MAATTKEAPKDQAVDKLLMAKAYLEKQFGKNILMNLEGDSGAAIEAKDLFYSGHPFVDYVCGGGFFYGKNIELYGMESSGKTTLAYMAAAQCQKRKFKTGRVLLLDYENAFDMGYFKALGGLTDPAHFLVTQPEDAETGFEVMRTLIHNDLIDMVIVDSVAAMMSFKESGMFLDSSGKVTTDGKGKQQGAMGEITIGLHSRVIATALRQLNMLMAKHKVCVVWINQVRTKINTNRPASETTTGGNALKFYAAIRLEMRKIASVKGQVYDPYENKYKEGIAAVRSVIKAAKNKEASPFREMPLTIRFGTGFAVEEDLMTMAVNHGIVKKGGTGWYETKAFGATRNARGEEDFVALMREEPEVYKKLLEKMDFDKILSRVSTRPPPVKDRSDEVNPEVQALLSGVKPPSTEESFSEPDADLGDAASEAEEPLAD